MEKLPHEIEHVIAFLQGQAKKMEEAGNPPTSTDAISIQLEILQGQKNYANYSNEPQEIESVAYDITQWMHGEWFDPDTNLFGDDYKDPIPPAPIEDIDKETAITIIESYYGHKVVDYYNKKIHNMTLKLSGPFIVEGSNFKSIAIIPGSKTVMVEITSEKLAMLKKEMEA